MTANKFAAKRFYRYDGDQRVLTTKAEVNEWIVRTREGAARFRWCLDQGKFEQALEWANEAAGCGAELQNIAEATLAASREG